MVIFPPSKLTQQSPNPRILRETTRFKQPVEAPELNFQKSILVLIFLIYQTQNPSANKASQK